MTTVSTERRKAREIANQKYKSLQRSIRGKQTQRNNKGIRDREGNESTEKGIRRETRKERALQALLNPQTSLVNLPSPT